jgi:uncharacterized paraquat-inducible protein A
MSHNSDAADYWKCPMCGLGNAGAAASCERCGHAQEARAVTAGEQLGRWSSVAAVEDAIDAAEAEGQSRVCAHCRTVNPPDHSYCLTCGKSLSREGRAAPPSQTKLLTGLAGSAMLVFGVFTPLVNLPIVGGISYINNGRGDGVFVLILGIASVILSVSRAFRGLFVTGGLTLAVTCFTFFNMQSRLGEARAQAERSLAGNPFRGIGDALLESVQMSWGWGVLLVGALLLLATPVLGGAGDS